MAHRQDPRAVGPRMRRRVVGYNRRSRASSNPEPHEHEPAPPVTVRMGLPVPVALAGYEPEAKQLRAAGRR